jgi:hypothetical protein
MKKIFFATLAVIFVAAQIVSAHDPRTVAKDFSHSMTIDGAGKLTLSYKSMHWNEPAYLNMKKNETLRTRVVGSLWKNIGKFETEFDVVISGVKVPKGTYNFGLWFGANDDFKIVLGAGGKDLTLDLTTAGDGALVEYLTFDLRPTAKPDTFTIEGRGGKFRSSTSVQVPYLSEHGHPAEKKN